MMAMSPLPVPVPSRAAHEARLPGELRLADIIHEIPGAVIASGEAGGALVISGVHQDSRRVMPGDLFVARGGARVHGASYIAEAVARGARAILVERGSAVDTCGAVRIEAEDVSRALAFAAAAVYGHPTFAMEVVGITGTNGKTTTAHLVRACLDACGERAGIVGTLGYRFADLDWPASHTSPEADEIARIAAAMKGRGATYLVMEVSSIALAAGRVEAVRFRAAAFTNLTQDHLDYHGSMTDYAEAKARLFMDLAPGAAALNVDDPFGRALAERIAPRGASPMTPIARFSTRTDLAPGDAEVFPVRLSHSQMGIDVLARTPQGNAHIRSPLLGAHNVSNLLTALAIVSLLDLDVQTAAGALSERIDVPGRLERCDTPGIDDIVVLVDYAHTPDALSRVLESVRALGTGRIICVFGCGGDRDPKKRPLMGEAVGSSADLAIVTNDNPRSEDPEAIVNAILPGLGGGKASFRVELDRSKAIDLAVSEARAGDVVLVAGKGHEPYQIIGAVTLSFDDRDEARRALAARRSRAPGAPVAPPSREGTN
jgi:UDP-N-acetylmuramoyl-L-alanyl-D-glutamate--2,6-diaminopimelate ligase